jgi:hypothetical protein
MSADPTRPLPEWWRTQGPAEPTFVTRRRRRKGPLIALITLIVIVVLLVVSDRVANAYAENQIASQVQSSLDLSGKPHVSIQGFPFWTQLLAHDFKTVDITASNETIDSASAGGGALEIASLNATVDGLHFHGFNSTTATVDEFNASALITFTALANVGGIPRSRRPLASARSAARRRRRSPSPGRTRSTSRSPTPTGYRCPSWGTWPTSASPSRSCRPGCRSGASA